jgi:hypothetical protein
VFNSGAMPHETRVSWPARQMYSRTNPIGRMQIFAAFAAVLSAIVDAEAGEPEKIAEVELPDWEYLGYWVAKLTYRITAGEAKLICNIDPILASMGVSGENHAWCSTGLPRELSLHGSALSSGRQASWATLVLEGLDETRSAELGRIFAGTFPPSMTAEQLEAELEKTDG